MSKKLKNLCFIALLVTFILSICVIGLINLPTQAYTASATEQTQEESLVSLDVTDKITIEGKNYSSTMAGTNENIRFGLSAGAQIRIVDEETTGIRFSAYLSRADYNTLVDKYGSVELGFRLAKGTDAPTTAKDAPISKYVIMTNKTPDDVSDDVIRFNIVFKKSDMNKSVLIDDDVSVMAYVKANGNYALTSFSTDENTRSAVGTVNNALASEDEFLKVENDIFDCYLQTDTTKTGVYNVEVKNANDLKTQLEATLGLSINRIYDKLDYDACEVASNLNNDCAGATGGTTSYLKSHDASASGRDRELKVYTDGKIYKVIVRIVSDIAYDLTELRNLAFSATTYNVLGADIDVSSVDTGTIFSNTALGVFEGDNHYIKGNKVPLFATSAGSFIFSNVAVIDAAAPAAGNGVLASRQMTSLTMNNVLVELDGFGYDLWNTGALFGNCWSGVTAMNNVTVMLPSGAASGAAITKGYIAGYISSWHSKMTINNCNFITYGLQPAAYVFEGNSGSPINITDTNPATQTKYIDERIEFNNSNFYANSSEYIKADASESLSAGMKKIYDEQVKSSHYTVLTQSNIDTLLTATSGAYVLGEDIDMSGKDWNPTVEFNGILDGQGYAIKNLKPAADKGLFNTFNGVLKNIAIIDATLTDAIIANNITASGAILEDVLVTIKTETDTTTAGHKQGLFKMLDANGITLKNVYVSLLGEQSDTNGLDAGFVGGLCFDDAVINLINCYFVSANPNTTLSGQAWGGYIQKTENYDNVLTEGSTYSQYASIAALVADSNNVNNMSAQLKALFNKNVEVEVIEINQDNVDLLMTATDGYYKLTEDVDLSGIEWNPTGTFTGALDGQGYSIDNLTVTSSANGLFNDFCGYIGNVALTNVKFRQGILAYTTSCSYSKVENVLITCNEYETWHEKGLFSTVTAGDINLDNVYVMLPSDKGNSADDVSTGFISGTFAEGHKINLNNCYFVDSNTTNVIGLYSNITDANKIPEIVNGNYKIYNSNDAVENDTEYFNGMSQELKSLYNKIFA